MPLRALSVMIGSMAERSGATSQVIDAIWLVHDTLLGLAESKLRDAGEEFGRALEGVLRVVEQARERNEA